jgi:hypothetical protein
MIGAFNHSPDRKNRVVSPVAVGPSYTMMVNNLKKITGYVD